VVSPDAKNEIAVRAGVRIAEAPAKLVRVMVFGDARMDSEAAPVALRFYDHQAGKYVHFEDRSGRLLHVTDVGFSGVMSGPDLARVVSPQGVMKLELTVGPTTKASQLWLDTLRVSVEYVTN
jgi:hypothetical protein